MALGDPTSLLDDGLVAIGDPTSSLDDDLVAIGDPARSVHDGFAALVDGAGGEDATMVRGDSGQDAASSDVMGDGDACSPGPLHCRPHPCVLVR